MRASRSRHATVVAVLLTVVGHATAFAQAGAPQAGEDGAYAARVSEAGVTLEVRLHWRDGSLTFEIAANTHAADLAAIDLAGALRLRVGESEVRPAETRRLSGHHARATAIFNLPGRPPAFALVVRGVPDRPVRILRWPDESRLDDASDAPAVAAEQPVAPADARVVGVGGIQPSAYALVDARTLDVRRLVRGLGAVHGSAVSPDGRFGYALDMGDAERALTVLDLTTGRTVRTIALPAPAHHAVADADGTTVYVGYGLMGLDPDRPRGIAAVDPRTGAFRTVETEGTPFYVAAGDDGSTLYAAVQQPNRMLRISLPAFTVARTAELPAMPSHIAPAPHGDGIYVTLVPGRVVRLDVSSLVVLSEAETAPDAHGVAVAGRPARLFVASRAQGTIDVFDPGTLERTDRLELTGMTTHLVTVAADRLLVSTGDTNELILLDAADLEVAVRRTLPFQPHQAWPTGTGEDVIMRRNYRTRR